MEVEFKFIRSLKEMINTHSIIQLMYPNLLLNQYELMLSDMITKGYSQIEIKTNNQTIGVVGIWENTKLWCGKYIELDNVVLSSEFRSQGVGNKLMVFIEKYASKNEVKLLACDAYNDNYKAIKFYYNQGFIGRGVHFVKKI